MEKTSGTSMKPSRARVPVDLALQGGGAHGAFTWGVLDRILEEDWIDIVGISGTSAGAMNAAVMADGHAAGGAQGAQRALADFWESVADAARFSPLQASPIDLALGNWSLSHSPAFVVMDMMSRLVSPYVLNPAGTNPLAGVLDRVVDFDRLHNAPIKVFVTATNVRTGRGRVFRNAELSPDVLMASACLPTVFQAVEIDGESYWDGGYAGNPTLTPLVREVDSDDTILIPINPIQREGVPRTAAAILNRLNEVSFNAATLKELRMIALLRQVADTGNGEGARWARMRVHMVQNEVMNGLDHSSKMNADRVFLHWLRDRGRVAAEEFLRDHGDSIGNRPSIDLDTLLDGV